MKKTITLLLFLAGFAGFGCTQEREAIVSKHESQVQTQQIQINGTEIDEKLEQQLIDDVSDGKLDMPFERAALIASGTESFMLDFYEDKLDKLDMIVKKRLRKLKNSHEKAEEIFSILRQKMFMSEDYQFRFQDILYKKKGNCLALSTLFHVLCKRNNIKSGFMDKFDHIFNFVEYNDKSGNRSYIDLTKQIGKPSENDLADRDLHEASELEALSNIYEWHAVTLYEKSNKTDLRGAEKFHKKGLLFYPDESIYNNLVWMYESWAQYDKALEWVLEYIKQFPKVEGGYIRKAQLLNKLKKYDEALAALNEASEISGEDYPLMREIIEERINEDKAYSEEKNSEKSDFIGY